MGIFLAGAADMENPSKQSSRKKNILVLMMRKSFNSKFNNLYFYFTLI